MNNSNKISSLMDSRAYRNDDGKMVFELGPEDADVIRKKLSVFHSDDRLPELLAQVMHIVVAHGDKCADFIASACDMESNGPDPRSMPRMDPVRTVYLPEGRFYRVGKYNRRDPGEQASESDEKDTGGASLCNSIAESLPEAGAPVMVLFEDLVWRRAVCTKHKDGSVSWHSAGTRNQALIGSHRRIPLAWTAFETVQFTESEVSALHSDLHAAYDLSQYLLSGRMLCRERTGPSSVPISVSVSPDGLKIVPDEWHSQELLKEDAVGISGSEGAELGGISLNLRADGY